MANQPQFRYTQPPSKVIHLRNLPWECTDEELLELGKPFGKVINTKTNVGANRNQAFIEFAELNQAISMISFYASAAEPAQVRGKTVYLQYSNRQEIVNSKAVGEVASNCLLVTMEGVQPDDVSIDVLHLVFSAFGFVHKIATFEKTAGYQALIQFSDSETASNARNSLDGRAIPSYLLKDVGPCTLKIAFSGHTDLNVKFQSNRSRDYTNPYLPVAPSAIDGIMQDGKKTEAENNVLLASVENMQYPITIDTLHTIFSSYGFVQKIAIFEKNSTFQALIQYPDIQTASSAKRALEGHNIYQGGFCKLHLQYSRHTDLNVKINNDRGRDYTGGSTAAPVNNLPSILGPLPRPLGSAYNASDQMSNPSHESAGNAMGNQYSVNQASENMPHMLPPGTGYLPQQQPSPGSVMHFVPGNAGDQPPNGLMQGFHAPHQPSPSSLRYLPGEGMHQPHFPAHAGWQQAQMMQPPALNGYANHQFMPRGPGMHFPGHGHPPHGLHLPGYVAAELSQGYDHRGLESAYAQANLYPHMR